MAETLGSELEQDVSPEQIRAWLYADLPEQQLLTSFDEPTPEALIERYNLSQAQGVLYRASHVVITAHRNDPGEYKLLFRYVKLFGLMAYIEGDADHGFTLTIDGPTSLFTPSTRYGLALAKMLPALLHVTRWSLSATLVPRRLSPYTPSVARFRLDADCGLVSHYPPGKLHDSMLEQAFAERWSHTHTPGGSNARSTSSLSPVASWCPIFAWCIRMVAASCWKLSVTGAPSICAKSLRKCVELDVTISFWPFLSASTWSALVSRLRICQPASCGLRTGYCPKPCWRC